MSLQHIQLRPKENKALARQLGGTRYGGELPKPYAGPTITPIDRSMNRTPSASSAPLLQALNGPAPDIQGEAWARREEIVAANQAKLDAEADALYQSVQGLSPEDQKYMLDKVVTKGSSSALASALGAEPGSISPAAIRTDPLMKTMMDKNYIKKTATGYDWMLPEKAKPELKSIEKWVDESGWSHIITIDAEGNKEDEIIGREAKEEEPEKGLTVSEAVALERLSMDKEKAAKGEGDAIIKQAIDLTGPKYRIGEVISGKIIKQKDVDNWNKSYTENYNMVLEMYGNKPAIPTGNLSLDMIPDTTPEVKTRKEEIALNKAQYEDRPDIIMTMEQLLGMPSTGKWSPQLEYMLFTYGMEGK